MRLIFGLDKREKSNPKFEARNGARRATFGPKSKMAPKAPQIQNTKIPMSKTSGAVQRFGF
jgi:hypothetical protein